MALMRALVVILLVYVGTGMARRHSKLLRSDSFRKNAANNLSDLEDSRIVGGTYTTIEQYPYIALLPNCGATIIDKEWIVTAGHCYSSHMGDRIKVGSTYTERGPMVKIKQVFRHPDYYVTTDGAPRNDVMLLKLEKPLTFSSTVKSIKLGSDDDIQPGQSATALGYGKQSENGPPSLKLSKVDVPIVSNKECQHMYRNRFKIAKNELCAGYKEGKKDACQGDSGGPLVINNRLIGITSYGDGCARPNSPGVYPRVPAMKNWINQIMEEN